MPENSWYMKGKYFLNPLMPGHLPTENCYCANRIKSNKSNTSGGKKQ